MASGIMGPELPSRTMVSAVDLAKRDPRIYDTIIVPTDKPLPPVPSQWPISDSAFSIASTSLIVTLIMQIVATLLLCARIYIRAMPIWRFTIDDWLISAAFV
jgi:hypothetical protein